jgi:hypothetical protein
LSLTKNAVISMYGQARDEERTTPNGTIPNAKEL